MSRSGLTRRRVLATGALAGAGLALGVKATAQRATANGDDTSFVIISDTHMLADATAPGRVDTERFALNERLIDVLNILPDHALPASIGGGRMTPPIAVLHLGDIADSGDKLDDTHARMTATEFAAHAALYGSTGRDGRLRYPLYEIHGNHDTPRGDNVTITGLARRNANRPGVTRRSANGLHYSWDWNGVHFVMLGLVVGVNRDDRPISRYGAWDSLAFLEADLAATVGPSGRPVILMQHVDLQRYAQPCDTEPAGGSRALCCEGMARIAWHSKDCPAPAKGISMSEWSPCDVRAYHRAIAPYNVSAIFHGHLHARRTDTWTGSAVAPLGSTAGIPVFGVKNAGAGGTARAFFWCRIANGMLEVREYRSDGEFGWDRARAELGWEPHVWRVPVAPAPR
jgi:cytolysin (calcineurin-like family phosphatase)